MRERTADQRLLELLQIGRVAWLAFQVGCNVGVELGELLLWPFPELSVRDVVVLTRKFLLY